MITTLLPALAILIGAPAYADELMDARVLYKKGDATQALQMLDTYLGSRPAGARGPKIAQAWFMKGLILAEQNRFDPAASAFSAVIKDYPQYPEAYNNLAAVYAAQGRHDKARAALEAGLATHPVYATLHRNLKKSDGTATKATMPPLALVKTLYGVRPPKPEAEAATVPLATPAPPPVAPASPPAPAAATTDAGEAVLRTVNAWAATWSNRNVKAYLACYARDFKPGDGSSRAAWEKSRRKRIAEPASIRVEIESPRVTLTDASHASVAFTQRYRSDSLKTSTHKVLELERKNGKWLIVREHVAK
ncbi:MAG: tetratricopeptide repeat protein [Pseudomonadota bacterium]